jgi:hypothetical protein
MFQYLCLLIQRSIEAIPHDKLMRAMELLGTKVAPVVSKEILYMSHLI